MFRSIAKPKSYVLLAVLSAAACADGPTSADKPDVTPDVMELDPQVEAVMAAQEALAPVAERVETALDATPGFSSVAVEPENGKIVVFVAAGQEAAVAAQVRALATEGQIVEVRPALLGREQIDHVTALLDDAQDELAAAGVELTGFGPDGLGGKYQVQVSGDLAAARGELARRFGADVADTIELASAPRAVPAGRLNDTAPYFGGARLRMAAWSCSSGFAARNSHGVYLITAGHCYDSADSRVWNGAGHLIGRITSTDIVPYDASFVKVSDVAAYVYNAPLGRPETGALVSSVKHPRVGERVCTSGSYGRGRCGGIIHGWRHVRYGGTGPTYALWYADQEHHLSIVGGGDSGGPVYTVVSGTASARGIISGGVPNATCPTGDGSDWCSTQVLFGDVAQIAIRHGLRLTGNI